MFHEFYHPGKNLLEMVLAFVTFVASFYCGLILGLKMNLFDCLTGSFQRSAGNGIFCV